MVFSWLWIHAVFTKDIQRFCEETQTAKRRLRALPAGQYLMQIWLHKAMAFISSAQFNREWNPQNQIKAICSPQNNKISKTKSIFFIFLYLYKQHSHQIPGNRYFQFIITPWFSVSLHFIVPISRLPGRIIHTLCEVKFQYPAFALSRNRRIPNQAAYWRGVKTPPSIRNSKIPFYFRNLRNTRKRVLISGFEPESLAWKASMIGLYTISAYMLSCLTQLPIIVYSWT